MRHLIAFRLDDKSNRRLNLLASITRRNRSKMLRNLIDLGIENPELILPMLRISPDQSKVEALRMLTDLFGGV